MYISLSANPKKEGEKMVKIYDTMDMNAEYEKKKWNIGLILVTLTALLSTLFLPADNIICIAANSLLTLTALICCIGLRKKYKVAVLITVCSFCLVLIGFLIAAFAMNYHIIHEHMS